MSAELTSLLDSTESPDAAVRAILTTPGMIGEIRSVLPALKAMSQIPAGTDGVKAVIGRRLVTFPQPQRSDAEAAAWWADYYDVLADVPLAALEAGMRAYVALPDSEFMPKPGRLRELAFTAPCRALTRYHRATRALAEHDRPEPTYIPPATPEELEAERAKSEANRQAILKIAEEFKGKSIGAATALKPSLPSIAGKVDAGGITQEMRDLIARRQAEAQR